MEVEVKGDHCIAVFLLSRVAQISLTSAMVTFRCYSGKKTKFMRGEDLCVLWKSVETFIFSDIVCESIHPF